MTARKPEKGSKGMLYEGERVTGSAPQAPRLQGGVKERWWIAVYSYPGSPAPSGRGASQERGSTARYSLSKREEKTALERRPGREVETDGRQHL